MRDLLLYLIDMDIPEAIVDLQKLKIHAGKRVWQPFMQKYNCQTICELGILSGENFELMISHTPIEAVAVDAWANDGIASHNDPGLSQMVLDQLYKDFKGKMTDKPFVKIYREYTTDATHHFPEEHFDLIYIDADHTYEGCLADLVAWYPKVKKGGFIVGDDYRHAKAPKTGVKFGVIKAVNRFTKANMLKFYEVPRHGWAMIRK